MSNPIGFPGLGLTFNPNSVAFQIFGKSIYWYGIIIAVGFLLAAYYTVRNAPKVGVKQDDFIDAMLFGVPVSIIFSRLYYVIFNLKEFTYDKLTNPYPQKFYEIWKGGIAIYGAIIGAVLTILVFSHFRKLRFTAVMDVASLGLLIGQCIGRWGNFINREAFGTVTKAPWRMEIFVNQINGEYIGGRVAVHPTFLYESLWTLLGFLVLHRFLSRRKFSGQIFLMYVAWYGLGRSVIEGLRTDSLYLFGTGLRVSQWLAILSCVTAVGLLIYNLFFRTHDASELTPLAAVEGTEPVPEKPVAIDLEDTDADLPVDETEGISGAPTNEPEDENGGAANDSNGR
jgi:phosphatidylglycerol:prolipoprotein diacylglycerol transferase